MRLRFVGVLATLALITALGASGVSAVTYATVTGYAEGTAANNHEETWETAPGIECTKLSPGGDTYELPALAAGLAYDLVIVKAGSDSSTEEGANTLFDDPTAGQTVFADADASGTFTDGDKIISHIIVCVRPVTTSLVTQSLMLEKVVTSGSADAEFGFRFGTSAENLAALASTVSANDAAVLLTSTAGTFFIAEDAASGWNFGGIACPGATATVDPATPRMVRVELAAGQHIVCTFTNSPSGTQSGGGGGSSQIANPSTPVRTGTLANTAMEHGPADPSPVLVLALVALTSSAIVVRRNVAAIKQGS